MVIRIKQIDAFTEHAFQGNAAAVVLDGELIKDEEMQLIAREMNLSETAYICPLSDEDVEADFRLRWFTPTTEVDLCGHATIAALHALAEEGRFGIEIGVNQRLRLETRSGILPIDIEWDGKEPVIYFGLPIPAFRTFEGTNESIMHAIGLEDEAMKDQGNILQAENGYLYVLLKNHEVLAQATPNEQQLRNLYRSYGITAITCVTTTVSPDLPPDPPIDWQIRFFAPVLGVLEDPVTGSANGPTLPYLQNIGELEEHRHLAYGAQGKSMGRLGIVKVEQRHSGSRHPELLIAGKAVTVLDGTLKF